MTQGVVFVVALAIVTFANLPGDNRLISEFQNTAHTFAFGFLALLALASIRSTRRFKTTSILFQYITAGVLCLFADIGVEVIQVFTRRDADIWDVIRDCAGIITFLGFYSLVDHHIVNADKRVTLTRSVIAAASFLILLTALLPAGKITYAYIERERAFPQLLDFDKNWYRSFISPYDASLTIVSAPSGWSQDSGKSVARVTLQAAVYSGIEVADPHPDWSDFSILSMKIYSTEAEPFPLALSIHDQQHNFAFNDRFNHRFDIKSGENEIRIPLTAIKAAPTGREMDMRHIKTLLLFATRPQQGTTFYIVDMRLE